LQIDVNTQTQATMTQASHRLRPDLR
jgi:hypothetical protein